MGNHSSRIADKKGMQEHLFTLDAEYNKKVPEIEPDFDSEDSEKCANIADRMDYLILLTPNLTDAPLKSITENRLGFLKVSDIEQYVEEDNERGECGNIADFVEDGDGLPCTRLGLAIVAMEEKLVSISLAVVHLVDGEWSVEVGKGDFSIVRHIIQGSTAELGMMVKVGDNLRWSISKDVCAFKLGSMRYLFHIRSPKLEAFEIVKDNLILSDVTPNEVLNYVVSFQEENESLSLDLLDKLLGQHAQFTDSSSDSEVEGYNNMLARAIAAGTGILVKNMFFLIDAYSSKLEQFGKHVMDRMEAKCEPFDVTKPAEKSPDRLMKTLGRLRKATKVTEKISEKVVIKINGLPKVVLRLVARGGKNKSKVCQKLKRTLPVEMVYVSWVSFRKIMATVEESGKSVLISTSAVATDIARHRFGERAGGVTAETLAVVGHSMGTAYNVSKVIRLAKMGAKCSGKAQTGAKYVGNTLHKGLGRIHVI